MSSEAVYSEKIYNSNGEPADLRKIKPGHYLFVSVEGHAGVVHSIVTRTKKGGKIKVYFRFVGESAEHCHTERKCRRLQWVIPS